MINSEFSLKTLKASLIIGGLALLAFLVYDAKYSVLVSLIGIGIGTLISPVFTQMREKFKIPRALSALIFLILAVLLGLLVFFAIGFLVADQINVLSERYPQLIRNLQDHAQEFFRQNPWIKERGQDFKVEEVLKAGASKLFYGVRSGFTLVSGIGFIIVIALYTATDAKEYLASFLNLFPSSRRRRVKDVVSHCGGNLRKWFRAQLLDMLIIGLLTLTGLWIAGVEYWAVFGLLTAIFGLIPYLGIIIVVIVACFITLASDPTKLPWVLAVFVVTQQLESNLILPKIMKERLELPEMPLLIFMLIMGTWFGLFGIFLATPFFVIVRTLYLELYQPIADKS